MFLETSYILNNLTPLTVFPQNNIPYYMTEKLTKNITLHYNVALTALTA